MGNSNKNTDENLNFYSVVLSFDAEKGYDTALFLLSEKWGYINSGCAGMISESKFRLIIPMQWETISNRS
ncbi:hypothetical protein C7B69_24520 [filamentous cyanobacterium Phorm 46]|nr:hypothetical protein C7B69_24520 [filamentous cyanobacterium Phorm 46]PSB53245.1 hypothetical protein C7B67_03705 [filamentous cyanobacterium Phorm 6]